MVRVLLFGRLAEAAGWRERTIEPAPATLGDLRRLLGEDARLGEALGKTGVRAAIDHVICLEDAAIPSGAEVAFMPPMSGG